jgi:hypothetical protein
VIAQAEIEEGSMRHAFIALALLLAVAPEDASAHKRRSHRGPTSAAIIDDAALQKLAEGRETFRFDTFGDEAFWGGTLRLHEAIAGVTPTAALGLGLKVDVEALPPPLRARRSKAGSTSTIPRPHSRS